MAQSAAEETQRQSRPAAYTPEIRSAAALVVDENGTRLYSKNPTRVKPIASVTKLMTAMVVLDSGAALDETIPILDQDRDRMRYSRSRLRCGEARLSRREMLTVALMSSDNRAAAALGRTTFSDGTPGFVRAMNRKAESLGMASTRYADPTGLDGGNRSSAEDLLVLLRAASGYPLIGEATTRASLVVHPYGERGPLEYRNTNPLVKNDQWRVELSKTGYINEAGHCLVMQAEISGRRLYIVLLDSVGKLTPVGDSNRLRKWIEAGFNKPAPGTD